MRLVNVRWSPCCWCGVDILLFRKLPAGRWCYEVTGSLHDRLCRHELRGQAGWWERLEKSRTAYDPLIRKFVFSTFEEN